MVTLGIDTTCDETSVSLLQDDKVIVQKVSSQLTQHREWGGVVPMLAKRRHVERIEFIIADVLALGAKRLRFDINTQKNLKQARAVLYEQMQKTVENSDRVEKEAKKAITGLKKGSYYDPGSSELKKFKMNLLPGFKNPGVDLVAVTVGPGLAPALEIGIKAAVDLAHGWGVGVSAVNHMDGHLWSGLLKNGAGKNRNGVKGLSNEIFPAIGLLVSGGHTEMVLVRKFGDYEIIGETLDDAAGEAFDKFAVMLGAGYPGGPVVEEFAARGRKLLPINEIIKKYQLPVPMKGSNDLNFSYSGLKTAALYMLRDNFDLKQKEIYQLCAAFEYCVVQSIVNKLEKAVEKYKPRTILSGGGVIANKNLRKALRFLAKKYGIKLVTPEKRFLGDNASMIGLVGYYNYETDRNLINPAELADNPLVLDRRPGWRIGEEG